MTRLAWYLLVTACSSKAPDESISTGSASATASTTVVGCTLAVRAPGEPSSGIVTDVWTPYAASAQPARSTGERAERVTGALRDRLPAIDRCLADNRGSLRAMLRFQADGSLMRARIGGFGNAAVEDCVARAVGDLKLVAVAEPVEVACDLSTGLDTPWRVTVERYRVLHVTSAAVEPALDDAHHGTLVLAEPDAPGALIDRALVDAASVGPVLVAVQASGGAPVFVALAASSSIGPGRGISLEPDGNALHACASATPVQTAALVDVRAVDRMVTSVVAGCAAPCDRQAAIGVGGRLFAKHLVAAASAARRAGLEPIVVRGTRCAR